MHRNITLVPTINFDRAGPLYISDKQKGAGYFKSQNPLHTVVYSIMNGFTGDIKIQGTLVTNPTESDWVDVPNTAENLVSVQSTTSINKNFKGQYVWIRAVISNFTAGSLVKISYSYN